MSIKNKITPGPWRIIENIERPQNEWIESNAIKRLTGDIICLAPYPEAIDSLFHWKENKKAIAAVPEMLDILERLQKWDNTPLADTEETIDDIVKSAKQILKTLNDEK